MRRRRRPRCLVLPSRQVPSPRRQRQPWQPLPRQRRHTRTRPARSDDTSNAIRYFEPDFQPRVADLPGLLTQPRTPIEGPNGPIRTCQDLLRDRLPINAGRLFADYQICFAAEAISRARAPASPSACYREPADCRPAAILEERLDLRSFRNSLNPRFKEDRGSGLLSQLDLPVDLSSRTSLQVTIPDWLYRMDAIAAADFTGRGAEQWLVRFVDRARVGTYFAAGYLLIEGFERGGGLTARWLFDQPGGSGPDRRAPL